SSSLPRFVIEGIQLAARQELMESAAMGPAPTPGEPDNRHTLLQKIARSGECSEAEFQQLKPRTTVLEIQRRSKARLRKSQRLGKVIVGFMVLLLFLLCCFVFDALLISRPEIWSAAITAAGALAGLVFYPFPFEAREDNRHSLVTILNSEML